MGLPQNRMSDDLVLEPSDLTEDLIDALHSVRSEMRIFAAALGAKQAMPDVRRGGNERPVVNQGETDAELFEQVMK
jgi:hypothetical protein